MTTINDVDTKKRSDMIAGALTTDEMDTIIDGLTALSIRFGRIEKDAPIPPERQAIWDLRRLIGEAHATARRNETEA
jgi:hypothetical protein